MENVNSSKKYFRTLSLIHLAIIVGIVVLESGFVYFNAFSLFVNPQIYSSQLFMFLVPFSIIFAVLQMKYLLKAKLYLLKAEGDLKTKMDGYKEMVISRFAFLTSPCFIVIAAIARTNNLNYLLYVVFVVIILIIKRPTIQLAIAELDLNSEQILALKNPDSIIE